MSSEASPNKSLSAFKRILGVASALIAILTGVPGLIRLLQGNAGAVTRSLLILGIGLLWLSCTYVYSRRVTIGQKFGTPQRLHAYPNSLRYLALAVFLAIPILVTAGFWGWQYYQMVGLKYVPSPTTEINTHSTSNDTPIVTLHMKLESEKMQAATETVQVPLGVTIKVKRSRTIEHTINIEWGMFAEASVDIGLKQILSASVRSQIEHKQGRTYQKSETMEYEVELSGDKGDQYTLIWTDVWRNGTVEFQHEGKTQLLPFQFRERTELEVGVIPKSWLKSSLTISIESRSCN